MAIDFQKSTPLYLQIIDDIRNKISAQNLKVGDQLDSQSKLAQDYNVSLITVKKAIATLVQEGTLFSRVGKGIYVARNVIARSNNLNTTIGLVLRNFRSPFFSLLMHSIEEAAYKYGMNVLLTSSSEKIEKEEEQIMQFRQAGVSGLIIASMSYNRQPTPVIKRMLKEKFPFVMVSYISDENIPFVGTDNELGGFMAAEHLIKCGYKRIGFLAEEFGKFASDLRFKGFKKALKVYQINFNERWVLKLHHKNEWNDFIAGYEAASRFIKLKERPDAVFVYKDLAALGFEEGLLQHGLKIPDDVAIIGFDDIERAQYAPIPLTTIHQPMEAIGYSAVEMLSNFIAGKDKLKRIVLKPELVVRNSCKAIAGNTNGLKSNGFE